MKSLVLAAGLAAASISGGAQAAVTICTGSCVAFDTTVQINSNNTASFTQTGSAGAASVKFTSNEKLLAPSNGAARIESQDGVINSLTFELLDGYTFGTSLFNLNGSSRDSTKVTITYFDPTLAAFADRTFDLRDNGQNFMGISGNAGETFTKISFNFTNGGVADLRQLRFGNIAAPAVPEPATWAMMFIGFGVIGSAMRRRKVAFAFS